MAVILNNESIVPFFGERLSFVKGLDPLGLQNTSDTTFSLLLPGLNNVTGRIRYYSLYSWLLDAYSKESGSTNPSDQRQFIRRAEYIIALISQYIDDDSSAIPGSNYAGAEVKVNQRTNHNLQEATYKPDGTTRDTYWNYSSGALGQYYLGSLRDIGLIAERENNAGVYVRTSKKDIEYVSGEDLAEAFIQNSDPDNLKLFLACIKSGRINENQLRQLVTDFNLTAIPSGSEEQALLKRLLLQKDYPLRIEEMPLTLRRQTIKEILSFLNAENREEFYDRIFVYHCYDIQGMSEGSQDDCLMGWYYYQFNEFWQYACTSILNGVLSYLEQEAGPGWMPLPNLVHKVTENIISEFISQKLIQSGDDTIEELLKRLNNGHTEYHHFENTSETEMSIKGANAFLLLFRLYINNQSQLADLKTYAENNDLAKDGEGVGYFITQFTKFKSKSVITFIYEFIFSNIIYRHQYVAFKKIGGGSLSTQKFIIEDQHIRYIGNFDAGYTGPRIGRLIGFLKDLQIINAENGLTMAGKEMLKELS